MNTTPVRSVTPRETRTDSWALYKGWIMGGVIVLIVLSIGAALWLHYHP